jgi:F-type H+-transporting ATPase subunit b
MRRAFGLNTNILDTNLLDLIVVIGVVVVFVGDAFTVVLAQRRHMVLCRLREADQKATVSLNILKNRKHALIGLDKAIEERHERALLKLKQQERKAEDKFDEWTKRETKVLRREISLITWKYCELLRTAYKQALKRTVQTIVMEELSDPKAQSKFITYCIRKIPGPEKVAIK